MNTRRDFLSLLAKVVGIGVLSLSNTPVRCFLAPNSKAASSRKGKSMRA